MTTALRCPPCVVREVAETYSIKEGHVPDYTTPTAPLPADGPPVITVSHQGPGHEEMYTYDCQGGNPSSSSTTTLQYRDVFVLSSSYDLHDDETDDAGDVTRRASGAVRGLRQAGVPVRVVGDDDNAGVVPLPSVRPAIVASLPS
nr:hypothetical protein BaRGS_004030 [Batillaria attramentaria]